MPGKAVLQKRRRHKSFLTKTEGVPQLTDKKLTYLARNVKRSSLNESKRMRFNILKTQEDTIKLASNDKYTKLDFVI